MQFAEFDVHKSENHLVAEPEDLLPIPLAVAACNSYFDEVAEFREGLPIVLKQEDLVSRLSLDVGIFDGLKAAAATQGAHIDKIGLARAIVKLCEMPPRDQSVVRAIDTFLDRMKVLFRGINRKRRAADEEKLRHRVKTVVEQQRKIFEQDHPNGATREQGLFLFERIGDGLDYSLDAKAIRDQLLALTAEFGLDGDSATAIPNFDVFLTKLRVLKDAFALAREATPETKNTIGSKAKAIAKGKKSVRNSRKKKPVPAAK
jgi:hypothetical protein